VLLEIVECVRGAEERVAKTAAIPLRSRESKVAQLLAVLKYGLHATGGALPDWNQKLVERHVNLGTVTSFVLKGKRKSSVGVRVFTKDDVCTVLACQVPVDWQIMHHVFCPHLRNHDGIVAGVDLDCDSRRSRIVGVDRICSQDGAIISTVIATGQHREIGETKLLTSIRYRVSDIVLRRCMKRDERPCKLGSVNASEKNAAFLRSAIVQEQAVAWSLDVTSRYQSIGDSGSTNTLATIPCPASILIVVLESLSTESKHTEMIANEPGVRHYVRSGKREVGEDGAFQGNGVK
jgi:hypothetical protein